ncbi:ribonuclease Z [Eubacterium sp. BX4]|uniref:Ribonuclease Z n=1 Tax=Eubacterium segne TaxID=2763045 RepID=A0ABR7F8A9_9FIRM|nr:ribonuclease Z [Eubacterium segne]MBC5668985.1 ribonuclease Z [Eubacterium segne]
MLDVCLLGTGGMMPLPRRYLTSLMCRYNGSNILIDCGEGTQVAIKQKGWSFKPIDVLCITHYHADHISGLPGLLLTMGNAERTEPLLMIGPKGLEKVVNSLRIIAPELPFDIEFIELTEKLQTIQMEEYRIKAFKVNHKVTCYGYSIEIDRSGKFNPEKAKKLGIPLQKWGVLQKGESVEINGGKYTPDMVMGEPRKGLKVTYSTDTRPVPNIVQAATGADLFICEGMYGEPDKEAKAKEYKHMTFKEAAEIAREANPKEMWLTHYSPSLVKPALYMDAVTEIFENAKPGKDGMSVDLIFEEE